MPIRLLIADDHRIMLDGIVSLFQIDKDIVVVGIASNGYEVLDLVSKHDFDVALLDINMPGLDGIETTKLLKEKKPGLKIIILTTYNDKEIITEMLEHGVSGYLLKNSTKQELTEAIKKVAAGGLYFNDEVHASIMKNYRQHLKEKRDSGEVIILTKRENEILQLLAREYTNEKIANALTISYRTVETHRKNLMQKTKSHNLAGLLKYAYGKRLLG
jgi:two-component system nitrate/nitrite response regulator NarL